MITGLGVFIGCGYGSHTGIDVATLCIHMYVLNYSYNAYYNSALEYPLKSYQKP
jgi:hypothetical protein